MVGSVGSGNGVNLIQSTRALNAFKSAAQTSDASKQQHIEDIAEVSGKQIKSESSSTPIDAKITPQKKEFIEEFKNFARKYSSMGITDADIMYALKYGRSVLVDKSA